MAANTKAETHKELYTNILFLTIEYPTTKEFDKHFRMDMFMKENKAAFQHVTHFLVNILNPELFQQRKIWPIFNVKMETKFCTEVVNYLNSIEEMKPLKITTSQLKSPGGNRFVNFMFEFSRYVVKVHAQKCGNDLLPNLPIKTNPNLIPVNAQLENLNKMFENQCNKLTIEQCEFDAKCNETEQIADYIQQKLTRLEQSIQQLKFE